MVIRTENQKPPDWVVFGSEYRSQRVCLIRIELCGYRRVSCAITYHELAAGLGLEPRYWASKAHVLPLDDPAGLESLVAIL